MTTIGQKESMRRYYEKNKEEIIEKKLSKYYQNKFAEKIEELNLFLAQFEEISEEETIVKRFIQIHQILRELEKFEKIVAKTEEEGKEVSDLRKRFKRVINSLLIT
jgi:hypothetical protein